MSDRTKSRLPAARPRPDPQRRKALGAQGESLVAEALVARGFTIVETNLRSRWGEIDLIARKGGLLWLVEVKTRRKLVPAGVEISRTQQQRLARMAYSWLARQSNPPDVVVFTVVLVTFEGQTPTLTFFEHAFDSPF